MGNPASANGARTAARPAVDAASARETAEALAEYVR